MVFVRDKMLIHIKCLQQYLVKSKFTAIVKSQNAFKAHGTVAGRLEMLKKWLLLCILQVIVNIRWKEAMSNVKCE